MKFILKILVWCFCVSFRLSSASNTYDWHMVNRCKEHDAKSGYKYERWYEVFDSDGHRTNESAFEMHLAILAASNGHIALSSAAYPDVHEDVYEIVVGGGGNKFTELRRNLHRNSVYSTRTNGILSPIEFRGFYIKISEDGIVEFGKEGDPLPLITYNDINPITVKFFSFAAWNGVEAKFLFDCPPPGSNGTGPRRTKMVEPKLSPSDYLKRTLLMDRTPYLPPGQTVDIGVNIRVTSIKYNTYDAKLTLGLAMVATWTDRSLAWNPDKFNGIKVLKYRQGEIWSPSFFVFNADDKGILESKNPELITMTKEGEATLHFQTTIDTWCHDDETNNKNKWPNDEFECLVLIGAWQPHERFVLHVLDDSRMNVFADVDDIIQNEWDVHLISAIVPITVWKSSVMPMDNETHQSDRLAINLEMKRRATALNIVFYTPLFVLMIFVLLSFWNESLQMSRIWFYATCSVAITAGLCYVNYLVPCHTIPTIMILYTTVLMGVVIALLVQVLLMTPIVERLCKTAFVQSFITAKWFRAVFCLPTMKTCRNYDSFNEGYASHDDDDSGVIGTLRNDAVEEMQAEDTKYGEKEELAEALDKFMFFVYSLTFAIMLGLHY